jgi:hypothetical protein
MAIIRWCIEELGLFESGGKKFKVSFIQNNGDASNGKPKLKALGSQSYIICQAGQARGRFLSWIRLQFTL